MSLAADFGMVTLTLVMLALLGSGLRAAGVRGGRALAAANRLACGVLIALVLWLAATALVASTGVLAVWNALPPRWPLLPLTAFTVSLLVSRTQVAKRLIAHTPRTWPIAAQTFRVLVELVLFALYSAGRAPQQITFEGRNFDILVGLSAPPVAWLVARGRVSALGIALWNMLGLAILANTIGTVVTSTPGPLHLNWPGAPFAAVASWPVPAFLAPLAVFFHLVSLRQAFDALREKRSHVAYRTTDAG